MPVRRNTRGSRGRPQKRSVRKNSVRKSSKKVRKTKGRKGSKRTRGGGDSMEAEKHVREEKNRVIT